MQRATPDDFKELIGEAGNTILDSNGIEQEIVNFYKNLYENYDKSDLRTDEDNEFFEGISSVSAISQDAVTAPITSEELYGVMKSSKDSAPGPDGIPYSIWTGLWSVAGEVLLKAWHYTLETKTLAPSHKVSFLKLIPKAGKDLKKLTNWRPISLSNCDHKSFTKIYANRLSRQVAEKICENQTAYLKGRLINDNIRALRASLNVINNEADLEAVLVALDAKKAFDSVEHGYIEICLKKFGFSNFVPIFKTLYKDLHSDIIVNGKVVKGYRILRGVKQGDALSCILFIMCVEPLLRNIEKNDNIEPVFSNELNASLPKSYAFADDVNCFVKNNMRSLQGVFDEYDRLSRLSGLKLNAEKTELLHLISTNRRQPNQPLFSFSYGGERHDIAPKSEVKINGVLFHQEESRMRTRNVEEIAVKIDKKMKMWSKRNLSILGKILVVKTFGVSQIIFLMQSLFLNEADFKKFNSLLYKFIWNRHYLAAKAPERISREITNKSVKLGGLGMLDIRALDDSLKLRALGRLKCSKHPMLKLVANKVDMSDFFYPKVSGKLDEVIARSLQLLKEDRQQLWRNELVERDRMFLAALSQIKLTNALTNSGKISLAFFAIRLRGKSKVEELDDTELNSIGRFLDANLLRSLNKARRLPRAAPPVMQGDQILYHNGKSFTNLSSLSSKLIRELRGEKEPVCVTKIGLILAPTDAMSLYSSINKLTSTRSKDIILRFIHGELYSKERLFRYQLVDSPACPRCDQVETLAHKYLECDYVKEIWRRALTYTNRLRINCPNEPLIDRVMCSSEPNVTILTIHAEILFRIRGLDPTATYVTLPKIIVTKAIEKLARQERKQQIKEILVDLLNG